VRKAYLLCLVRGRGLGEWDYVVRLTPVDRPGLPVDELKAGLRGWALEQLRAGRCVDGVYNAYLVDVDEDGEYDTSDPVDSDEVVWLNESEYVPVAH
jgi:hypothetical protein